MFGNRWRWNVTRALAVLRQQGGRRVPIALIRMRAEDLLAAVFPEQVACGDNHAGPIAVPDHPLVTETIQNCLREAMDVDGLRDVLDAIHRGEIRTVAVETAAPSPMSHEILNANPYAFLDDAPLEERRARAVSLRRTDPELARTLGALDAEALAEVRAQAWPDLRTPDELHDLLLTLGVLPVGDAAQWPGMAASLGPVTAAGLSARLGLPLGVIDGALAALEHTGVVLQGRFTPGGAAGEVEWCDRRLLARIHRLTLGRLRREIEPVAPAAFMRFLF